MINLPKREKKIHKILCYLQKESLNYLQKYLCGRFYVLGEENKIKLVEENFQTKALEYFT